MGKRIFDIVIVLLASPIWLPLLMVPAVAIRLLEGGPSFFIQERPGLSGKPFRIIKFRTMTDARDADGNILSDAERLTRLGTIIRSTSLDEIPQLLNVLKGDMSLVGPRPLLMEYLPLYSAYHARRHEVRPGITGLAQVSGRNLLEWEERFDLDVEYVDSHSMLLDVKILFLTAVSVIRRHGISSEHDVTMPRYRGPET